MANTQIVHKFTKSDTRNLESLGYEKEDCIKIAEAINKLTGAATRGQDYMKWLEGSGSGSIRRFDRAVRSLFGKELYDYADCMARLDIFLRYTLSARYRKNCIKSEQGLCEAFYRKWRNHKAQQRILARMSEFDRANGL